ncbi:hypothetical protein FPZ43_01650 [Mucilaginibacter pallidiroseus]|uniref:Uncharacterized protein n=1 Tax=Mucilaginibacter pallidiroseus TaxID=2599295 RepID=A0A563UIS4_9SPHI|nr:hypothetical protein [Mucilaginibacter pallidiroseus]TWR31206.1 hypothetical protein FPZ43_01650 [Mucilaginibacter pallidiroseus]
METLNVNAQDEQKGLFGDAYENDQDTITAIDEPGEDAANQDDYPEVDENDLGTIDDEDGDTVDLDDDIDAEDDEETFDDDAVIDDDTTEEDGGYDSESDGIRP